MFSHPKQLTVHFPRDSLPGLTPEVMRPAQGYNDDTRSQSIDHVFTFEVNMTSKLTLLTFLIHISGLVRDSKEKKSCLQSFIKIGHISQDPASSQWINQVISYFFFHWYIQILLHIGGKMGCKCHFMLTVNVSPLLVVEILMTFRNLQRSCNWKQLTTESHCIGLKNSIIFPIKLLFWWSWRGWRLRLVGELPLSPSRRIKHEYGDIYRGYITLSLGLVLPWSLPRSLTLIACSHLHPTVLIIL